MSNKEALEIEIMTAFRIVATRNFFDFNEYITKRLIAQQYNQYTELASVCISDIIDQMKTVVKPLVIRNFLNDKVKAGEMKKDQIGSTYHYWRINNDFLTQ